MKYECLDEASIKRDSAQKPGFAVNLGCRFWVFVESGRKNENVSKQSHGLCRLVFHKSNQYFESTNVFLSATFEMSSSQPENDGDNADRDATDLTTNNAHIDNPWIDEVEETSDSDSDDELHKLPEKVLRDLGEDRIFESEGDLEDALYDVGYADDPVVLVDGKPYFPSPSRNTLEPMHFFMQDFNNAWAQGEWGYCRIRTCIHLLDGR